MNDILKNLKPESYVSVWTFFRLLGLVDLPHYGYEKGFVEKWNNWINEWKSACISKDRDKGTKLPKIQIDKLEGFLNECKMMWLIGESMSLTYETSNKVDQILTTENPT